MRRLIFTALAGGFCMLLGSATPAQRLDGTLRVTVSDKSQASVEEAKVSVTNDATGVTSETTASSSGTYVFPNLLVGTYTVSVEKDGFKKAIRSSGEYARRRRKRICGVCTRHNYAARRRAGIWRFDWRNAPSIQWIFN